MLQAEGRASSAAVRMKLIAVVCDQPVQLVVFFCLFATKNNIDLKFAEMIVWRHMIQSMKVISFPTLPLWPDHPAVTTSLVTAVCHLQECQHSRASQEVMSQKRLHVRCFITVESQQKYKHCDCSFSKKAPTTAGCRAMLLPADPPQAAYTKAFWENFLFPVLPFSRQQNILSFRK